MWTCPDLTWGPFTGYDVMEGRSNAERRELCGTVAGTCNRELTPLTGSPGPGLMPQYGPPSGASTLSNQQSQFEAIPALQLHSLTSVIAGCMLSHCLSLISGESHGNCAGIKQLIEPTDACELFNATNLQCLRCMASCPSACLYAVRKPSQEPMRSMHQFAGRQTRR